MHQSARDAGTTGFWASLRRNMRGEPHDFTSGSLARAITFLAIPMVLEMFMQAVFEVVDVFFVGKLGADAVAAVGLTGGLVIIVFSIATGLGMATTAMVARRIGERDPEGASRAAAQGILLGLACSIPVALAGIIYPVELLTLMGASSSVAETGAWYCTVLLGTNAVIILLFVLNAVFRGTGDAVIAMRVLWLANLLNMLLDPLFIFGWGPIPAWGVTGAAIATVTGRSVGILLQLWILVRGSGRIQLKLSQIRLDLAIMARLAKVSSTGVLQYLVSTASWLGLMRIIAEFGSAALAGYTIAVRLIIFALLPSWGMGNAAATLVGQNLGAGKPDRAERSVWISGYSNMVFLGLVAVVFIIFAEPLLRIFSPEDDVVAVGVTCLRIVSSSYLFLAFGMVMGQSFNGAGDTWTPTKLNFLAYWLVQIPLAYLLSHSAGLGSSGVFIAIAIAQAALAVASILVFRQGRWKMQAI